MSGVSTQLKVINIAIDELNSELGDIRCELEMTGHNAQDDRRSHRAVVYHFERKLRSIEERIAKLESRFSDG